MTAAKFKEQCPGLLDHLSAKGIIVTKGGKPIARVTPVRAESAAMIGAMKGKIRIKGNLLSCGLKWDAQRSNRGFPRRIRSVIR